MRAATSIYLFKDDVRFFGEGPCRLLRGIQECGSLRAAALKMNLSYSKAIAMVNRAEEALGFPLTEKQIDWRQRWRRQCSDSGSTCIFGKI